MGDLTNTQIQSLIKTGLGGRLDQQALIVQCMNIAGREIARVCADNDLRQEPVDVTLTTVNSYTDLVLCDQDLGTTTSGLADSTQYYFKVNNIEYSITTITDTTHTDIAALIDTAIDTVDIACTYVDNFGAYKFTHASTAPTVIAGTTSPDLLTTLNNYRRTGKNQNFITEGVILKNGGHQTYDEIKDIYSMAVIQGTNIYPLTGWSPRMWEKKVPSHKTVDREGRPSIYSKIKKKLWFYKSPDSAYVTRIGYTIWPTYVQQSSGTITTGYNAGEASAYPILEGKDDLIT